MMSLNTADAVRDVTPRCRDTRPGSCPSAAARYVDPCRYGTDDGTRATVCWVSHAGELTSPTAAATTAAGDPGDKPPSVRWCTITAPPHSTSSSTPTAHRSGMARTRVLYVHARYTPGAISPPRLPDTATAVM